MPEKMPKYQPGQYIMFANGSGYAFAQIEGGEGSAEAWIYKVQNPINPGIKRIGESEVLAIFEKDRWHDTKTGDGLRVTFL